MYIISKKIIRPAQNFKSLKTLQDPPEYTHIYIHLHTHTVSTLKWKFNSPLHWSQIGTVLLQMKSSKPLMLLLKPFLLHPPLLLLQNLIPATPPPTIGLKLAGDCRTHLKTPKDKPHLQGTVQGHLAGWNGSRILIYPLIKVKKKRLLFYYCEFIFLIV